MAVAVVVVVVLAVFAPLCYAKTDLVLSVCSNIADGTTYIFDMVTVPTEGIVSGVLLPAGVCGLCSSVQMSPPEE